MRTYKKLKSQLCWGWLAFFFSLLASGFNFFCGDTSATFSCDKLFSICFFSIPFYISDIFLLFSFRNFSNFRIFWAAYSKILNFTSYLNAYVMKSVGIRGKSTFVGIVQAWLVDELDFLVRYGLLLPLLFEFLYEFFLLLFPLLLLLEFFSFLSLAQFLFVCHF